MPAPPDTGDVGVDLRGYLEGAFGVFQRGIGFALLGALLVKERDDPELMDLFRVRVVRPRMRVLVEILERGVAAGQVRPDVRGELVAQMIAGALFAGHVAGQPQDAAWLRDVLGTLLRGIAPPD
jgi:hypothetical protein